MASSSVPPADFCCLVRAAWSWKAATWLSIKLWPQSWPGQQLSAKDQKTSTNFFWIPARKAARGIKHNVTSRQLPSCLLSAPCSCMRDVIADAYTSTASLQLLETHCTCGLKNHSLSVSPEACWELRRGNHTHRATAQSLTKVSPRQKKASLLNPDAVLLWQYTTHALTKVSRIPAWTACETLSSQRSKWILQAQFPPDFWQIKEENPYYNLGLLLILANIPEHNIVLIKGIVDTEDTEIQAPGGF